MSKRLFDFTAALFGLILLSPLLAAVALAVRVRMGGPVLFRQRRPGLQGRPFMMVKFRTMLADDTLPESVRITGLGAWLRATSLDELPELWNVLKGDMSLVGPRPLLMEYLPLYSPAQAKRHDARPGITGLAQVNGRNSASWERKFRLDSWYVRHQSLGLDLRILFRTVSAVFFRKGVNQSTDVSMPRFTGQKEAA